MTIYWKAATHSHSRNDSIYCSVMFLLLLFLGNENVINPAGNMDKDLQFSELRKSDSIASEDGCNLNNLTDISVWGTSSATSCFTPLHHQQIEICDFSFNMLHICSVKRQHIMYHHLSKALSLVRSCQAHNLCNATMFFLRKA